MGYKDHRSPAIDQFTQATETFLGKKHIPYCQRLINDDDGRIDMRLHRESEAHEHAAGVGFDGLVNELANVGERDDLVVAGFDFFLTEPKNAPVQEDVISSGKIRVEAAA